MFVRAGIASSPDPDAFAAAAGHARGIRDPPGAASAVKLRHRRDVPQNRAGCPAPPGSRGLPAWPRVPGGYPAPTRSRGYPPSKVPRWVSASVSRAAAAACSGACVSSSVTSAG